MREEDDLPRIIDRRSSQKPPASEQPNAAETEQKDDMTGTTEGSLAEQLAKEKERADANFASWQRSAADFQNYKRRVEQEREEVARLANASLIINLLPLIDDLERALESVDQRLAGMTWLEGLHLIHRKFQALLEMNGVTEIEADGQDFDPNVHEAVTFGEGDENKVISVVQKGYKLGGRVVRPALVVVGQSKQQQQE